MRATLLRIYVNKTNLILASIQQKSSVQSYAGTVPLRTYLHDVERQPAGSLDMDPYCVDPCRPRSTIHILLAMQRYLAALTIVFLLTMVLARAAMLRRQGVRAMNFGKQDKTDFLIPPFAFFYFYLVFAHAFGWPTVSREVLFDVPALPWLGVAFCMAGLLLLFSSLLSFGRSFRVGIDGENPDKLVTLGVFALSRNPIYVAFWIILLGQFLVFPNWLLLVYLAAASWLFHRQVRREETFLAQHYGAEYADYCRRVRRYL